MVKRSFTPRSGRSLAGGWSVNPRIALVACVLALLTAIAGTAAYFTGRADSPPTTARPTPSPTATADAPPPGKGSVPPPPSTRDPVVFAKAAARVLWSYDTRTTSHRAEVDSLKRWMSTERKYTDWDSVNAQIPEATLWSRLSDNAQRATAVVDEAHMPQTFKSALAEDPGAITEAYVYAVTVTGKQTIAWHGGGAGAESRSTTLGVQCRPKTDCTLTGIAPQVAP
ncbi:hypothetical protein [Streptomyces nigrescens]|uniref:hypothetical protein n=1 Tax=Streptomyces nigrescens TaxID=1920 RepID=UPI0036F8DFEA